MGALLEAAIAIIVLVRTRMALMAVWAEAHPWITAILGWIGFSDWLLSLQQWMQSIKNSGLESVSEAKTAVFDFFESSVASGLDFTRYMGHWYAIKVNDLLGLTGTSYEIDTLLPDTFLQHVQNAILNDIRQGGGMLLSGQLIQQLRLGQLPTLGFAAAGNSSEVDAKKAALDRQTAAANAQLQFLTLEERRKRLLSRARQARYRKTHRRVSHWVKKARNPLIP